MANLSRAYRPSLFSEIAGQDRITEILRKEVEQNKLGHAYLFSGPRGVGKTTAARIFAKAVNCLDLKAGEPCLKCATCTSIGDQTAIDIIEMDAASHTSVENIRESVIEHIRFVPAALKYKVYIIDEAHMLSTQAWNALLKTIEEPPAYALFIFATTEKHKVPATIVSRCQRFDFTRIAQAELVKRLADIAKKENADVQADVLNTIASRSDGCLRDAESLLGQLLGLGEKKINMDLASLIMTPSQLPIAAELLSLTAEHDVKGILGKLEALEGEGISFLPLFDDLIASLRKLMLAQNLKNHADALKNGEAGDKALAQILNKFSDKDLMNGSLILMERRRDAKQGLDPRFALELGLCALAAISSNDDDNHQIRINPPSPKATVGAANDQKSSNNQSAISKNAPTPQAPKTPPVIPSTTLRAGLNEVGRSEGSPPINLIVSDARNVRDVKDEMDAKAVVSDFSLDDCLTAWPKLLNTLEEHKSLVFILKLCKPVAVHGHEMVINFQYPYHQQTIIGNIKNKSLIETSFRNISGFQNLVISGSLKKEKDGEPAAPKTQIGRILDAFGGQVLS